MTVRLARITYERHIRVWRLRLDPDATGAADKVGDLIGSAATFTNQTTN